MNTHQQTHKLAQVLLAQPDPAACAACIDALDEYVDTQLAGQDAVARGPDIALHLDICVDCSEAYALLYEARLAEARAPEPAHIPAPDLHFLSSGPSPQAAGALQSALAAAVERGSGWLRLTLSQALIDLLPPPATPALALRGAEQGPTLLELTVAAAGEPVEQVDLAAYADSGSPDRCVLRLRLGLRGREWPDLADTPVTLRLGAEQLHALTDPWGEVVFEGLERARLPHLQVEVGAPASA